MCQTLTSQAAVAFIFIVACARISRGSRNEDLKYFGDGRRQLWFLNSFTLTPTLSRQREREQEDAPREAAAPTKPRPSAAMARRGLLKAPLAVPRSAGRGAGAAAQHAALRALTCCGCLSGVSAANKASSAAPPRARASQVARSEAEGHGQRGRLFFGYFLLARQKKVTAPPGAHPGQQRPQTTTVNKEPDKPLTPTPGSSPGQALSPAGRGGKTPGKAK